MIGLLVIAHAPLASALLQCARHVYTCAPSLCDQSAPLDVLPDANTDAAADAARTLCASLDSGQGVLVLTDLFGATPANVATQLARTAPGQRIEVVCGVNLPMLLRALSYRGNMDLSLLVEKVMSGAGAGIVKVASNAPQNQQLPIPDANHANARMYDHQ